MRLAPILTVVSMLALLPSEAVHASFTVNADLGTGTNTCASASSLTFVPGTPNTVNYRCDSTQTNNACTVSGALVYTLASASVTVGCSNLVATGLMVDATFGGVQNGDGTQTVSSAGNVCSSAYAVGYEPGTQVFNWTCPRAVGGDFVASCQPLSGVSFDLAANRITVACAVAAPTGSGNANPAVVAATGSTLLTVGVVPASNPTSTGITVTTNLTGIGGLSAQPFFDDGSHGDVTAGDNVYSFLATLPFPVASGSKTLVATITDAQARASTTPIALNVLVSTSPFGHGNAAPTNVAPTSTTLLMVSVGAGTNPISTGITVRGDLTSIGGSATQPFFDDGSNGDATPGDGVYSYRATLPYPTDAGAKSLPVTVADSLLRNSVENIDINVLASTSPTGFAIGTPDNVGAAATTVLTVKVTPGKYPTSTGINVGANLSSIGGPASVAFLDDGLNGDAVAGDGVYSYSATIGVGTAAGPLSLPISVADSLNRATNSGIALNITTVGGLAASGNAPTGTVGKPVTLRVTVTPGVAPASTNIGVTADLTAFGGSPTQLLWDDGQGADQTAGDNVFTYLLDTLPVSLASGPVRLPALATDAEGRSAPTGVVVTVRGDAVYADGYED